MTTGTEVKPNRRGVKSRELVLDAAERVMAADGFEAATVARVVEEAGIPMSSVYHYFGSKDGILLAVMERGAERFFADLPVPERRAGRPAEHLAGLATIVVEALERNPDFLRLLVVFAAQPPGNSEVQSVVLRVREMALVRLRQQFALVFGDDPDDEINRTLAHFALATIDGAFIASRADNRVSLEHVLRPFAASLVAIRRTLASA